MIAPPCAVHIPIKRIPAHVIVLRAGHRLTSRSTGQGGPSGATAPVQTSTSAGQPAPLGPPHRGRQYLAVGDRITVSRPAVLRFFLAGNTYRVSHGRFMLACRPLALSARLQGPLTNVLAVTLKSGRVDVRSGSHARRAVVLSAEMLAYATKATTRFAVERNPRNGSTDAWTSNLPIVTARPAFQRQHVDALVTYTAISDRHGLRLDVWPFAISPMQRPSTPGDRLPPYWADGQGCSAGCTASGTPGWPLRPFHQQHAIRSGINELRPANFHVAVDIEAQNFESVYAIQSGYASTAATGAYGDYKVTVGRFTYYHVVPSVASGQYVTAYRTVIGQVEHGFGHIAFEEGGNDSYLNPLRPGGSLRPYSDTEAPIIGRPEIFRDGRVIVRAFDPQRFVHRESYETPILAPAALAWRLYNARGRALTGLEFGFRGTGYISPGLRSTIFGPGASNPGFNCFYTRVICIPNWTYYLAGGLTSTLPLGSLRTGRYRLAVYAWDWADNRSVRDDWFSVPVGRDATPPGLEVGPIYPKLEYFQPSGSLPWWNPGVPTTQGAQ